MKKVAWAIGFCCGYVVARIEKIMKKIGAERK